MWPARRSMPERTRNTVFLTAIAAMAVAISVLVAGGPTEVDRVESIGSQIKCPVCQGESIANSPSQMARDMMALVEERVSAGVTDDLIISELLASYSGALLLNPPAAGNTLVLWLSPLAALVVGGLIIVWWRSHPPRESPPGPKPRSRTRTLVGGLILALAFASVVGIAGFSLQDRDGPTAGVAILDEQDLSSVSNETIEAVISANLDNPQIDRMRLALASRYVESGEYAQALGHYLAVADSETSSAPQEVIALVQMGRLVWDGNGEADLAISLFDQALEIDGSSWAALYNKGVVLWCGHGDFPQAEATIQTALSIGEMPDNVAATATADLAAISAGEACS